MSPNHISVCVPTFRRPRMLAHLLRCLAAQDTGGDFTFSVTVIDNDPAASARDVAARRLPKRAWRSRTRSAPSTQSRQPATTR